MHLLQWILLEVFPFDYDGNNVNGRDDHGDDDHDDDDGGDCNQAAWGGLVVHIRHKL